VASLGITGLSVVFLLPGLTASREDVREFLVEGVQDFEAASAAWDLDRFAEAAALFKKACDRDADSYWAHYWLGTARFHILLHRSEDKEQPPTKVEKRQLIEAAHMPFKRAVALNDRDCEAHAMLSTLAGMEIAVKPLSAVWLGPEVMKHKARAFENGPGNPRVFYLMGMSYYHGPGILGGAGKALESLLQAEELFQQRSQEKSGPLEPRWGHDHCLTFIARVYRDEGNLERAEAYYRKALGVNEKNRMARKGLNALLVGANNSE
jgi:tetratricopeptide (TPR) repeat protein